MFCSKCKKEIADDSRFCKFCGSAIEAKDPEDIELKDPAPIEVEDPAVEEMFSQDENTQHILPNLQYFNTILSVSSDTTRWLNFYIKALFPLNAVFSTMLLLMTIVDYFKLAGNGFNPFYIVYIIPLLALYTYSFFELYKMSRKGFILNIISLIFSISVLIFCDATYLFVGIYVLCVIVNLIYLISRKNLFFDNELHNEASILYNSQDNKKMRKHTHEYFDNICKLSSLPTWWLWFYSRLLIPLGLIFLLYKFVEYLKFDVTNSFDKPEALIPFVTSAIITCIAATIFIYIYTLLEMQTLSSKGYTSNVILLFASVLVSIILYNSKHILLVCVLLLIPNLIYFIYIKNLFYDEELHKAALDKIS